jgi:hypothetical protein
VSIILENEPEAAEMTDNDRRTALSWASGEGNPEMVGMLLRTKPELTDSPNVDGMTPLFWASRNAHTEVVDVLLKTNNVNVHAVCTWRATPLTVAVIGGHFEPVRHLWEAAPFDPWRYVEGAMSPMMAIRFRLQSASWDERPRWEQMANYLAR